VASVDFKTRFGCLLKTTLIVGFIVAAVYGVAIIGGVVMANAKLVTCENNLQRIGRALFLYRDRHSNNLPPYLTALYPDFIDEKKVFQCPADPHKGAEGAFPNWTRYKEDGTAQPDWREEFAYADLDGPTFIPWGHTDNDGNEIEGDKDTFPCSYYYRFNGYPADLDNLLDGITWAEHMRSLVKEYGARTPVVSCLWHLPQHAKDTDGVTTNLLYSLTNTARYPKRWHRIRGRTEKPR